MRLRYEASSSTDGDEGNSYSLIGRKEADLILASDILYFMQ